ncbi:MAG TPA: diguanylate cyclase [Phycisphaerae bacterium]|nr:diguanylate cyclase [Phycisphaerae bacterium]
MIRISRRMTFAAIGMLIVAAVCALTSAKRDHAFVMQLYEQWMPVFLYTVAGMLAVIAGGVFATGRLWLQESARLKEAVREAKSHDTQIEPAQFRVKEIRLCADVIASTLATMRHEHKQMSDVASRDPLTGLPNRRAFMQTLTREAAVAARTGWPLSLMMIDLDHFKKLNDTYGHQAGDFVLKRASRRMASQLRRTDEVARYGGEEFVVILPNTRIEQAREVAEQLCNALRCDPLIFEGQSISVTASIGVSEVQENKVDDATELIRIADEALYKAKSEGRDRVMLAEAGKGSDGELSKIMSSLKVEAKPATLDAVDRDAMALMGSTFSILQLIPDRHRVAQDIVEQVLAVLGGDRASIHVLDHATRGLKCLADVRLGDEELVLPEASLMRWFEDQQQSIGSNHSSVVDVTMEPIGPEGRSRPVVRVPLQASGEFLGVVEVVPQGGEPTLTQRQQSVLVALSAIGCTALRNCDRHQALQIRWVRLIEALSNTIHSIHPYMRDHAERVSALSVKIARELGQTNDEELQQIQLAGLLHDIGKIGLPRSLFEKRGRLRAGERRKIEEHCTIGESILCRVSGMEYLAKVVRHHHEHFDGGGYPDGLAGDEIPLESRIIAVADACDAMRSKRPYREGLKEEELRNRLRQASGTQFDPAVVSAYLTMGKGTEIQAETPRQLSSA